MHFDEQKKDTVVVLVTQIKLKLNLLVTPYFHLLEVSDALYLYYVLYILRTVHSTISYCKLRLPVATDINNLYFFVVIDDNDDCDKDNDKYTALTLLVCLLCY